MIAILKHNAGKLVVALLGFLPRRVARHLLFLLTSDRELIDEWGFHIREIHYYDPLPRFSKYSSGANANTPESARDRIRF